MWLPPSATAPFNARFNPQLPIAVIVVHCNFSAVLPSVAPPPPPLPIAIVPPAGRCHHCILPLQSCCRPLPPAAAHMLPPLHAVACTPHPLPTAARTLAACHLSRSFPRPLPPAAAHTHAACCPHPRRRCCILLHARRFHHCFRLHCHLRRCWCHIH